MSGEGLDSGLGLWLISLFVLALATCLRARKQAEKREAACRRWHAEMIHAVSDLNRQVDAHVEAHEGPVRSWAIRMVLREEDISSLVFRKSHTGWEHDKYGACHRAWRRALRREARDEVPRPDYDSPPGPANFHISFPELPSELRTR